MYVERQILTQGTHLALDKEYEIKETIGEGASCIVYLAENCLNSRKVLIKELYPIELGIFRDEFNALIIPTNFQKTFEEYKAKLKRAVQLQIEFHNAEDSCNSTSDAEEIIEYNNTLYVIMGRVAGTSYDKHTPENLASVLTIGRSLANAIAMYHSKEYLHLDIKAENVFKIKETDELIKLFDFDSVHTKNEVQNGECNISFTLSSASPELRCCNYKSFKDINETSDLFSIGALMFKKIMGRDVDVEDSRYLKKWDYTNIDLLKTVSPQTKSVLTDIFRKTLARNKKDRYQTATELISALDKAIELSKTEIFLANHNITTTTSKDYYISRTDKLKEIRERLDNYHIAYLYGIGGIGKSETAREYAEAYRNQYDITHLTHYSIGLKETISSLNFINLDDKDLKPEERYNLKLNLLSKKEMYSSNILLIIDNYNVAPESEEYKSNVEVMKDLKKLNIHILFTTRIAPNDGNRKIDIDELSDNELKELFFAVNPKDQYEEERIKQVEELIAISFRHTLTVDLVAHQTVQIERFGKKTLADYIAVLKNSGLNNEVKLSVYNNKDDNEKNDIIYEHIKALFNFSSLTEKERYVMVNACLLPVSGMDTSEFCDFIDSTNFDDTPSSEWGEDSTITSLVNSGWIKRVGENKEKISLHPTISNITVSELKPEITEKKCKCFCSNYLKKIKKVLNDYILSKIYIALSQCLPLRIQEKTVELANILEVSGNLMCNCAQYNTAINFFDKSLNIIKQINDTERCVELYIRLADVHRLTTHYQQSISYYEIALNLYKNKENFLSKNKAHIYTGLSECYLAIHKDLDALSYIKKAMQILESLLPNSYELASAYCLYIELSSKYGFFEHKYYINILKILNQNTFDVNLKAADILYYIGLYNKKNSNFDYAILIFSRVLYIRKKALSENHIKIADTYFQLGKVYLQMKHKKASKYLSLSLNIYSRYVDHKREELYKDLITAYKIEQNWYEVKKYQLLLLDIYKQKNASNDTQLLIANHLFNIGYTSKIMEDYIDAYKFYLKSIQIYEHLNIDSDFSTALKNELKKIEKLL